MQALVQLRRSYSIGLGIFAVALPFFVLSMDSSAAGAKAPPHTVNAAEPTVAMSETEETTDAKEIRTRKNIKLNYVSASWVKILRDFAEATQTELVADRVPGRKYSRWDMKSYTRDEALAILNEELQAMNFRLQFKGHYLVLTELHEMRHEYSPAVLRGNRQEPAASPDTGVQTAAAQIEEEPAHHKVRVAPRESGRPRPIARPTQSPRGRKIQQVSGEVDSRSEAELDAAPEPQPPVVTMVRLKARDAVAVSKIIYKAFKPQAELTDDGPRGLQGFLVRRETAAEAGRKGTRGQAGDPPVRFSIGIDEKKNQLAIENAPEETKAIIRLVKALDVEPPAPQMTVRAVAVTKDAGKLAAALQPELDRLSSATRKLARQTAQRNDDEGERDSDEVPPRTEERSVLERPGMRRAESRSQPETRGQTPNVPEALSRSIKGDVKVESIPELGVLVITGNDQDVQSVMAVIQEIERLSAGTAPEVRVAFLRHVSSEALAALLTSVYERLGTVRTATVQQSQAITVFPVSRPNAVLIVASKADMAAVYELIDELDQPSDPASEFHVFRLKNAVPSQVVEKVQALYPQQQAPGAGQQQAGQVGLVPRVRIIDDLRTNSVIVQARPRDMKEVSLLIADLDAPDSDSVNQVRFFQLKNAVADEVAATVSQAIQNVLAPARAVTAQGQGQAAGQFGAAQPAAGAAAAGQGAAELREVKSTILKFLEEEGEELRELRSGILADIRMTADIRTNTVVVTAPEESMELVAALIKRLDKPAAAVAEIK
ncbi:MAG: secretin N-terminal domain-containing protein, partial [Deltaproteobacteria bacterium]